MKLNENVKIYAKLIIGNLKSILLFVISVCVISVLFSIVVFNSHLEYKSKQLKHNVLEYNEVDREQLCRIAECTNVINILDDNTEEHYHVSENYNLKYDNHPDEIHEYLEFQNIIIVKHIHQNNTKRDVAIWDKYSTSYYIVDTSTFTSDLLNAAKYILPTSVIIFMIPLFLSIKKERDNIMAGVLGNEALLTNKSMIMITENLHHELNTPLEVIDNKVEKIKKTLQDHLVKQYVSEIAVDNENDILNDNDFVYYGEKIKYKDDIILNKKIVQMSNDFEFIKISTEQIYNILEKMKGFKHLRYSNGNKSIHDIASGAFKMIEISNTNFKFKIDENLRNYGVSTELRNADLLNVFINHIKNSLEASASEVVIAIHQYNNGRLNVRILDNGTGIPKEAMDKVFVANFSTKRNEESTRGNGMYLNKHIIENAGGRIKIINTSVQGTTIDLAIPAIRKGNM